MEWLFWLSVVGVVYSYFIYPLILVILPKKPVFSVDARQVEALHVSLIITAHNEQLRIRDKIENSLNIDYPADKMEILVASDCSNDDTDAIVLSYAERGVKRIRANEHKGKEYAQGLAIKAAEGGILVFSDVATQIPADAFNVLTRIFTDPEVGAVSSDDKFISEDGKVAGEGLYVRYEMWLRSLESKVAGLVGLSGSLFAARREVCMHWDDQVPSDFNTALNCRLAGYRAISDPRLIGVYKNIKNPAKEYQRKVRTVIRGLQALVRNPIVLNPFRFGLFAFQVWSHKVMRWVVPWFLLLVLVLSLLLMQEHGLYFFALLVQLLLYGLILSAVALPGLRKTNLIRIPYYFLQANLAVAHATLAFALGRRITRWKPSDR